MRALEAAAISLLSAACYPHPGIDGTDSGQERKAICEEAPAVVVPTSVSDILSSFSNAEYGEGADPHEYVENPDDAEALEHQVPTAQGEIRAYFDYVRDSSTCVVLTATNACQVFQGDTSDCSDQDDDVFQFSVDPDRHTNEVFLVDPTPDGNDGDPNFAYRLYDPENPGATTELKWEDEDDKKVQLDVKYRIEDENGSTSDLAYDSYYLDDSSGIHSTWMAEQAEAVQAVFAVVEEHGNINGNGDLQVAMRVADF